MIRWLALLAALVATPALALDLALPANARLTAERNSTLDGYVWPIGPFVEDGVPSIAVEGEVRRSAWRIASPGLTTLQVLAPLRRQLADSGFELALDCDQTTCGGFDFRFATEVLPAPNMYVNIRAYRFIAAYTGDVSDPDQVISILVSTSPTVAYAQVIRAGVLGEDKAVQPSGAVPVAATPDTPAVITVQNMDQLIARGSVVLSDLDFATGTSNLGPGPFDVLKRLAALLEERPDIRIALVGHTDSVGGLDGNIALSKRRAQSVRQRLIDTYGVDAGRIDAEGMGYLSPAASHLTPEGREANRRVEAIVLPAE